MLKDCTMDWDKKSWVWKQGWLMWEKYNYDTENYYNPHKIDTERYNQFKEGWNEAEFCAKVDGGWCVGRTI